MPTPHFPDLSALVADASPHVRRAVREMLMRAGIRRVLEAPDGAEAITLLSEGAPDLVVVDWDLPVLSGEDFVRLARTAKTSPAPRLPIIVMLSLPRRSSVELAIKLGANEILAKPFPPKALWARLDEVINRPRPFVTAGNLLQPQARGLGAGGPVGEAVRPWQIRPRQDPAWQGEPEDAKLPGNERAPH